VHIYLAPLGDFGDLDVEALCDCVRAFYFGAKVSCLRGVTSKKLLASVKSREERGFGTQIDTSSCHKLLDRARPADAFIVLGFTRYDLYPRDDWNFVFGQALPSRGTGVFSFARYEACEPTTFLRRCMAVLCHEIGHLFGIKHCIHWECIMNGSNGDSESDGRPMHLCPMDLAKLQEALGLDILERERALEALWRRHGVVSAAEFHVLHVVALTSAGGKSGAKSLAAAPAIDEGQCEPCTVPP